MVLNTLLRVDEEPMRTRFGLQLPEKRQKSIVLLWTQGSGTGSGMGIMEISKE